MTLAALPLDLQFEKAMGGSMMRDAYDMQRRHTCGSIYKGMPAKGLESPTSIIADQSNLARSLENLCDTNGERAGDWMTAWQEYSSRRTTSARNSTESGYGSSVAMASDDRNVSPFARMNSIDDAVPQWGRDSGTVEPYGDGSGYYYCGELDQNSNRINIGEAADKLREAIKDDASLARDPVRDNEATHAAVSKATNEDYSKTSLAPTETSTDSCQCVEVDKIDSITEGYELGHRKRSIMNIPDITDDDLEAAHHEYTPYFYVPHQTSYENDHDASIVDQRLSDVFMRANYFELRQLRQAGLDFGKADERGNTALHYAAIRGDTNIVRLVLNEGASVWARNRENRTPFELAGNLATAMLLADSTLFYSDINADSHLEKIQVCYEL